MFRLALAHGVGEMVLGSGMGSVQGMVFFAELRAIFLPFSHKAPSPYPGPLDSYFQDPMLSKTFFFQIETVPSPRGILEMKRFFHLIIGIIALFSIFFWFVCK